MDKEKLKEAMKWYKRKIAIILGINIDDIKKKILKMLRCLQRINK